MQAGKDAQQQHAMTSMRHGDKPTAALNAWPHDLLNSSVCRNSVAKPRELFRGPNLIKVNVKNFITTAMSALSDSNTRSRQHY